MELEIKLDTTHSDNESETEIGNENDYHIDKVTTYNKSTKNQKPSKPSYTQYEKHHHAMTVHEKEHF